MRRLVDVSRLRIRIRRSMRRSIRWLWAQEGTPGQRARGVAAGVFCGCYPFFGLQIFLSIGLASALRGNHLLAAAATLISNPFTYLPLYWFNFQVGCWILGPPRKIINFASLTPDTAWEQGWSFSSRLLLGSSAVAFVSALAISTFAFKLFESRESTPYLKSRSQEGRTTIQ